ncbi:hypothetical protein FQA39_LY12374 [Lamprigera yunnana]|nr:hypothetical protein FQA39_LY12374 [Lamprigera yunnana]
MMCTIKLPLLILFLHVATSQKIPPLVQTFWTEGILPNAEDCIVESKVDRAKLNDVLTVVPLPFDQNLGCFFNCITKKLQFVLPNGEYDEAKFFVLLPEYERPHLRQCIHGHTHESHPCKKIFWVYSCLMVLKYKYENYLVVFYVEKDYSTMKLLLVILCLHLATPTPLQIPPMVLTFFNDVMLPNSGECIAESKVDPTKVRDIFKVAPLPFDQNLGCFLKCISEQLHFLLPNGVFDETKFFALLPDYEKPLLTDCIHGHVAESDPCVKVFWVYSCLLDVIIQ